MPRASTSPICDPALMPAWIRSRTTVSASASAEPITSSSTTLGLRPLIAKMGSISGFWPRNSPGAAQIERCKLHFSDRGDARSIARARLRAILRSLRIHLGYAEFSTRSQFEPRPISESNFPILITRWTNTVKRPSFWAGRQPPRRVSRSGCYNRLAGPPIGGTVPCYRLGRRGGHWENREAPFRIR